MSDNLTLSQASSLGAYGSLTYIAVEAVKAAATATTIAGGGWAALIAFGAIGGICTVYIYSNGKASDDPPNDGESAKEYEVGKIKKDVKVQGKSYKEGQWVKTHKG